MLLAAGVVAAGFNLRIAVASVPPVIDDIRDDLDLSAAAAGLLTSVPVLCFGLLAPVAPVLARRYGAERVLLAALLPLALGCLVRGVSSVPALFAGTILAGAAIAIANVVVPTIVRGRFAHRTGTTMGVYVAALGVGATIGAALTVPLERAFDSWELALAFWALPALAAAVVLAPAVAGGPVTARGGITATRALLRDPLAWQVTLFMGLQSLIFYSGLAWLPSILRDEGFTAGEAGAALSLYALGGIPPSLVVPPLATRLRSQSTLVVATAAFEVAALAGLLAAPGAALLWVVLYAIGQGSAFSLALTLIVLRSPDAYRANELSGMAQSIGYTLAAAGPLALGALHDATGDWTAPLGVLLALTIPLCLTGVLAGRDAQVRGRPSG
jgi:CP family cyanate transporter-like MFS transporter